MKKLLAVLLAVSLVCTVGCEKKTEDSSVSQVVDTSESNTETVTTPVVEEEDPNMITNYDFSSRDDNWFTYIQGGNATVSVDNELGITIVKSGKLNYAVQLYQDVGALETGCKYELKFDAKSTIDREFEARIQLNGGDYHPYVLENVSLTSEMKTYTIEFTMEDESDLAPRLAFNLGTPEGLEQFDVHTIYFDNFSLILLDDSNKVSSDDNGVEMPININQLGYRPDYTKIAIFRGDNVDDTFDIINVETGETVFTGNIANEVANETADETNLYGNFSELTTEGTYKIKTENLGESYEFKISNDIYDNAYKDVIKMLYLQRCGCELTADLAGDFAHPACHTSLATNVNNEQIDVSGGWHDAGDYGRYVVPGAKTVADLLLAYESNPDAFGDDFGIPESSNGVPDILDEARYELEWMLKMQDPESGGVYHKVTCANFPGTVMPQEETDELIVSPISHAATGDFAAVMAMSYDNFKEYDEEFANKCLEASKEAWDYMYSIDDFRGFENPQGIITGEYGDETINDEYLWASVELYKVTLEDKYNEAVKTTYSIIPCKGLGWADVGSYAVYDYLRIPQVGCSSNELPHTMRNDFIAYADELFETARNDGYLVSMKAEDYVWGSNMVVANNAMILQMASKLSDNSEYMEVARNHIHYLFGANPMATSYVTGYGAVSPVSTHHRPSQALNKTMPGMLVGGPNANLEDPTSQGYLTGTPPAKCYLDDSRCYSLNEITIYWNSPLIYIMTNA